MILPLINAAPTEQRASDIDGNKTLSFKGVVTILNIQFLIFMSVN